MKFDTARAHEWIEAFDFPRAAGSDGERRAAAVVAAGLARAGLEVELRSVHGSRWPSRVGPWLGWVGVGLWATALAIAARRGATWPIRLSIAIGALLWLRLTVIGAFRLGYAWPPRVATTNVVAWRDVEPSPPVRVVFLTTLDTFDPGRSIVPTWLATPLIATVLSGLILLDLTTLGLPSWLVPLLLGLLWLAIGGRVWFQVRKTGGPDCRDNRSGLAVLLELARTWPRGTHARIETRFVATGGRALDRAGMRAIVRSIASEWPARPTLVVEWLAPGVGPGLALMEHGTGSLAEEAANDLWVPHHTIHQSGVRRDLWPFGRRGPCYVGIVGDATHGTDAAARSIDLDALARASQIATEVVLRWARKMRAPTEDRRGPGR